MSKKTEITGESNNHPDIYPHLVNAFAKETGGIVGVLEVTLPNKTNTELRKVLSNKTNTELGEIKDDIQRKQKIKNILTEALQKEARIFQVLPNLGDNEGDISLTLQNSIKKYIKPICDDIIFFYEHSTGVVGSGKKLKNLINSPRNEAYKLVISYKKDTNGEYFIKDIALVRIKSAEK